jgi:hypothetical protein
MNLEKILLGYPEIVRLDRALIILKRAIFRTAFICFICGMISGFFLYRLVLKISGGF